MSSIEMDLAHGVTARRQDITDFEQQLRGLNVRYPGERKKPTGQRDPEYHAQRTALLDARGALLPDHYRTRRVLRRVNRGRSG